MWYWRSLSVLVLALFIPESLLAAVDRTTFRTASAYLAIEVLDDDLVHLELSAGDAPPSDQPLYTSPMVAKTDYQGPSLFSQGGAVLETRDLQLTVNEGNLCVTVRDKTKGNVVLTTVCPVDLQQSWKGLHIDPASTDQVYGLGEQFRTLGSADGDWIAHGVRDGGEFGNLMTGFQEAAVGNVQIPVLYAVGPGHLNYALFLDNVYKQTWNFQTPWWDVHMFGDQIRLYILTGPDLPDLRRDYMELVGRPPVPPRKAFGLWISEFGYDTWQDIDRLKDGLRAHHFPVDGFVLDLNWFGGVNLADKTKSRMGVLDWDTASTDGNPYFFPDPAFHLRQYSEDHLGIMAIEESYVNDTATTFTELPPQLSSYQRTNGRCDPTNQSTAVTDISGFWGSGRMFDWSDPQAGQWVHEHRRLPNLVDKGVTFHWTDLGEPENYDARGCYEGLERTTRGVKNEHADVHNLYNFLWHQSIWTEYAAHSDQRTTSGQQNVRPFLLARSGASGIQRFGAALWSGDIASNLLSLASHFNAQMHLSFSGIDYFGADVGGFRREVLPFNDKEGRYRGYDEENYTQWFANASWFDTPVRPHTDNEFVSLSPPYATAPHLIGQTASNLANIRQRYELLPYYYSLAYRAYLFGEPLLPPLVFYYQDDPNVRGVGHEKLLGRDLLVAVVSRYGEYERNVYLPAGVWINYHTNEWVTSTGQTIEHIPAYRDGLFRLPVFARAGAILPQMHVDDQTKDVFGHRLDGAASPNDLIVQVYAAPESTSFTLYEDDGTSLHYDHNQRPQYQFRETSIHQQRVGDRITVTIEAARDVNGQGPSPGAVSERRRVMKLAVQEAEGTSVELNGTTLNHLSSMTALEQADSGWINADRNLIIAKSAPLRTDSATTFSVTVRPRAPVTSVNFVCDKGVTVPGESVYITGSLAQLGTWDPQHAIKLDPNVYYEYIWNPPTTGADRGHGPSAPVWTGVVTELPTNESFEWKCLRIRQDGEGAAQIHWQPGANNTYQTTTSGYAGRAYGSF